MNEPTQDPPSAAPDADDELLAAVADEFAARARAGEHVSIDEYAAKHPALAERIRKVLAAVAMIEQTRSMNVNPAGDGAGSTIGRYKLLERIGEGGFGVVYMAEQHQPVRRKVALKVVKPGMDSRQVLARFEAERQALAIMDHPNIAKVFDGGMTQSGRPYFVMELVKGEPITEYCDRNQLPPRQRLELFAQVCHAVQHAHQKGIIHRDLKPSNVLVAVHDTTPVVKVIDFGIAKALGQELTEKTVFTGFAQLIGTPLYMSPEQAGQSALDVDTRSDIYSLGVLLYELLTGTTPFDKERFGKAAQDEIRRIIREEEPPRPSTRLSESKDRLPSISAQRHTEPAKLTKLVRGELDWIVMKALEKDRKRRYETASGFAADVQRYLTDEPVLACPPSAAYRTRKFVRRNKGPAVAGALVLLTLIGGIAGTTFGLVRADRARRAAAERADGERRARQEAQEREAETGAVLYFVENYIFAAAQPEGWGGLGYDVTLRQAIEAAVPSLEKGLAGRPLIEARLRRTLGQLFGSLGESNKAAEQYRKALTLYSKHRGPNQPETLAARSEVASSLSPTERVTAQEEILVQLKAQLGAEHAATLMCMNRLAGAYSAVGRRDEALKLYEETLAVQTAKLLPNDGHTLILMMNLASQYHTVGRLTDSVKLYEKALALMIANFGPDHSTTLICKNNVSGCYQRLKRHDDAVRLLEETVASAKAKLGQDHPSTLGYMRNLGVTYRLADRHDRAIEVFEETLAMMKLKFGPDEPRTLQCRSDLSLTYQNARRWADAVRVSEESLVLRKAKFGPESAEVQGTLGGLAKSYRALGKHDEARRYREELRAILRSPRRGVPDVGPARQDLARTLNNLAWDLVVDADPATRDPRCAVDLAKAAVELAPGTANFWDTLGAAQYRGGEYAGAVASLQKCRQIRTDGWEYDTPFFLAMAHWQLGDHEEGRRWYDIAVRWMDEKQSSNVELKRFRAEAAQLLGVDGKKPARPSTAPTSRTSQPPGK